MAELQPDPAHMLAAQIIRSLTEHLAQQPALPALDIADLRSGLLDGGRGYFGQAEASGPDRALKAAAAALADLRRNIRQGFND
jgi:cell division GTPase FtsZ